MTRRPYDQRIARVLVRPLVPTPVRPNHITTFTLVLGLAAAVLFATGEASAMAWGAGVFVLARFLDHFDGELARQQGTATEFGARYDYVAGGVSYAALFVGIGIGLAEGALGRWAAVLTALGLVGGIAHTIIRLACWQTGGDEAEDYPGFGGFQLEDGIYLLAPITWFGWLDEFFVLAALGAVAYGLWTAWTFWRRPRTGARA